MRNIIKLIMTMMISVLLLSCALNKVMENTESNDSPNISLIAGSRGTTAEHQQIEANLAEKWHDVGNRVSGEYFYDSDVQTHLSTINANGSWSDLDLSDQTDNDGIFEPGRHLSRTYIMAYGYSNPTSSYYADPALLTAIEAALQNFYNSNPYALNWWHNQVGMPSTLGKILILLRYGQGSISSILESDIIARNVAIYHEAPHLTGGNLVSISQWRFYHGILLDDSSMCQEWLQNLYAPLALTTGEGIQHDFSFHQHGPQFLALAYGETLIGGVNTIAEAAVGTSYALGGDQLDIYSNFARESYGKPRRAQYVAYNTIGRGISRPGSGDFLPNTFESIALIDSANATEYNNVVARAEGTLAPDQNIIESHTHYNRSKFTVHNKSKFNYSLLTASDRLDRLETGNGENLKGRFLSDGSVSIMVDGDEYFDIFPLWDWNKIPGVTAPLYTSDADLRPVGDWGQLGSSTFTGGVSNAENGLMVYDLMDYNSTAKKSWFFFNDDVVHLGAGISSTSAYNIATTLNQVHLDGDISYSQNSSVQIISSMGDHNFDTTSGLDWVWHNKIGYFFLDNNNVHIENESRSGNWYDINNRFNELASGDVFSLWIDHGNQPNNADYAYVISPGVTNVNDMQNYNLSDIIVLENSSEVQAVKHSGLDMLQIVFYTAKTVTYGDITITVSAPATIIFENITTQNVTCTVADPGETSSQIRVDWVSAVTQKTAFVDLPTSDAYKGESTIGIFGDYVPPAENTETFTNLQLDGWGSETYTGDNNITWSVNGKGVTGYINQTKHIYFHGQDTVPVESRVIALQSGTISGGISSFSAEVKNLWDTNEHKLELIINGNVVDTIITTSQQVTNITVDNINIAGDFTLALRNVSTASGNNTTAIDNITWEEYTAPPQSQTETLNNLQLSGWGTETYTGDNGITWSVNGKGVTGYINGTKHIYFHGKDTVPVVDRVIALQSGTISGGIKSFSAEVKNLWDSNEHKLELLINGNVVDTIITSTTNVEYVTVDNINISGDFTIALRNVSTASGNNTTAIDNITWVSY